MSINDGGPVFPQLQENRVIHVSASGMTLRDAAALAALQGFCADPSIDTTPKTIAAAAWNMADAFIAAREAKNDD
jgi:hypothetical protein